MASIALVFLLFAQIAAQVQDPAQKQLAPFPADSPMRAKRIEEIRETIKQLDSKEFEERSAATEKLKKIACLELQLIKEAAGKGSPEVKMRVRQLIENYSNYSHILTDAVGNPIPGASVTVEFESEKQVLFSNGCGHLKFDKKDRDALIFGKITVSHKDYGVAWADSWADSRPDFPRPQNIKMIDNVISVPLVNRNSEARARSASGKVVDADGKPVANALVTCGLVRTPGMGSMRPVDSQTVIANDEGEFSLYLDHRRCQNHALPSKLIPPNSNYSLQVEDRDGELFSWGGTRTNLKTEPIVLQKSKRKFDVRFLDEAGKEFVAENEIGGFRIAYRGPRNECSLGGGFVKRGWLLPGTYTAIRGSQRYEAVTIKDDSPSEITFQVAKCREVSGTVVDAETGQPWADAMVISTHLGFSDKLVGLTDDEWSLLEETSSKSDEGGGGLKLLRSIFGDKMSATKSDANGKFVIAESEPGVLHTVVVFTRSTVPMAERLYCIDKRLKDGKGNPRFTLYPSAFVTVKPKQSVSVKSYARWVIHQGKTPELTELLKSAVDDNNDQHGKYSSWMRHDESAKLMVPANTRMQIKLMVSGENYSDIVLPQEINLRPGEHLELDPFDFEKRIPLKIHVVDQAGTPVEGVSVRVSEDGHHYSRAVNTDVNGKAVRMVAPNAGGFCRVGGTMLHSKIPDAKKLKVKFNVGEAATEPLVVKMTQEQIDAILVKPNR